MLGKRGMAIGFAALMSVSLLAGCSGGAQQPSASSSSSASVTASSTSEPSSSADASKESSSASSSSSKASESSSSSSGKVSGSGSDSDDFDRALIGTWHIYSSESTKTATTKTDSELTAWMRKHGMHDTLTFFSDGSVQADKGTGNIATFPWSNAEGNTFDIEGMLDDPSINGDEGEGITVVATLADNRLTLEYDTVEDGHVKLVYSKS